MTTLENMKRVGELRTKGEWKNYAHGVSQGVHLLASDMRTCDAEFIALASAKWERLMAVVEAAKKFESATREFELENSVRTACSLLETRGILVLTLQALEEQEP